MEHSSSLVYEPWSWWGGAAAVLPEQVLTALAMGLRRVRLSVSDIGWTQWNRQSWLTRASLKTQLRQNNMQDICLSRVESSWMTFIHTCETQLAPLYVMCGPVASLLVLIFPALSSFTPMGSIWLNNFTCKVWENVEDTNKWSLSAQGRE